MSVHADGKPRKGQGGVAERAWRIDASRLLPASRRAGRGNDDTSRHCHAPGHNPRRARWRVRAARALAQTRSGMPESTSSSARSTRTGIEAVGTLALHPVDSARRRLTRLRRQPTEQSLPAAQKCRWSYGRSAQPTHERRSTRQPSGRLCAH